MKFFHTLFMMSQKPSRFFGFLEVLKLRNSFCHPMGKSQAHIEITRT